MTGDAKSRLVLLAVVAPIGLDTLYLFVSRRYFVHYVGREDFFAVTAMCLAGAWGLASCLPRHWTKTLAVVTYLPLAGAVLTFYSLYFVCDFFSDCL